MFTGLIEATGTIVSLVPSRNPAGPTRLTVSAPAFAPKLRTGDSIAVSGVCLTALDITLTQFTADLADETVKRTTLAKLEPGAVVNLELPTPAGSPMGGHVVQGHVDGVGTLISVEPLDPADETKSDWRLRLHIPSEISKYVASQGSITVDGISLTVADMLGDCGMRSPSSPTPTRRPRCAALMRGQPRERRGRRARQIRRAPGTERTPARPHAAPGVDRDGRIPAGEWVLTRIPSPPRTLIPRSSIDWG